MLSQMLLDILLTILKGYMDASANMLAERCVVARAGAANMHGGSGGGGSSGRVGGDSETNQGKKDLDAFLSTLVMTQNSAVVQILFEACVARGARGDGDSDDGSGGSGVTDDLGVVQEVRIAVCGFVHQLFIQNPLLLKLVNFQG
jgi:hypothetical protein